MAANDTLRMIALTLRSLGFASVGGTMTAVGAAAGDAVRLINITNLTNQHLIGSLYGTRDEFILPSGSGMLLDVCTNKTNVAAGFYLNAATRIHVRHTGVAPISGDVYVTYWVGANNNE